MHNEPETIEKKAAAYDRALASLRPDILTSIGNVDREDDDTIVCAIAMLNNMATLLRKLDKKEVTSAIEDCMRDAENAITEKTGVECTRIHFDVQSANDKAHNVKVDTRSFGAEIRWIDGRWTTYLPSSERFAGYDEFLEMVRADMPDSDTEYLIFSYYVRRIFLLMHMSNTRESKEIRQYIEDVETTIQGILSQYDSIEDAAKELMP